MNKTLFYVEWYHNGMFWRAFGPSGVCHRSCLEIIMLIVLDLSASQWGTEASCGGYRVRVGRYESPRDEKWNGNQGT